MHIRSLVAALALVCFGTIQGAAWADGVLPGAATPVQREQAQARFARGKEALAKKDYASALSEFRASHEIVASPNTRLELARCLRSMGKLVAAYAELGRTLVESKELLAQDNRYRRALETATAERAEIEPQLGFVTLTLQNPADETAVTIGGEQVRRAAWGEPAPVVAGQTEVIVTTPGHAPVTRTVSIAAGQKSALTVDAQSGEALGGQAGLQESPSPVAPASSLPTLRTWAYVAGGVGAVGLVAFAIAGVMAHSTYNDLDGACHGGPCPPDKDGEISSGKTQQTIANVSLVVGIAGAAAGGTLFVLSLSKSPTPTNTALFVGPGDIGLRGAW